jgi:hypothetical protein
MAEVSKSKPVRLLASVAAGSITLGSGLPLITPDRYDWIGAACGLLGVVITAGLAKWTYDSVTPNENVAARALPSGETVAGDASLVRTGAPVDVVPTSDTHWAP